MRIAYIYTALTSMGGVDRILSTKANYFAEQCGYEVYIITDSQAGRPPVFPLSPKVKHIDLETDFDIQYHHGLMMRAFYYFSLMRRYKKRLTKVLNEIRPDFVLTTLGRDMDFLPKIKDGSIKIGESHIAKHFTRNFHLMEQRGFPYKQIAHYWRRKQEKAVRRLDALVVLTGYDAESWATVRQAEVIPNPSPFTPEHFSSGQNKQIISVGRLNEQKGYDMLIEAWSLVAAKYPDWKLNIYGEGLLRNELDALIKEKKIEQSLHIYAPTPDIAEKYAESSLYVMSSRFEGFGLVLIEAMACGVPCISFDCPYGPSDIIRHSEDGLLIENGNIKKLAEAIVYLIEHKDIRLRMGEKARINSRRYVPEQVMNQWIDLFKKLKKEKE